MSVRIEITGDAERGSGIYGADGKQIPVGTELTLKEEPKGWAGRYRVLGDTKGKIATTAAEAPVGPFTVAAGAAGWFNILDAKGEKVGKGLREDDAKAFADLSTDDQAEFAAEHAKA